MKKWIKSSWGISIGTAIFSLLLTIGYDYSKEKPVLTTLWKGITWLWDLLLSFLNFNLKIWWIIAAIATLTFILFLFDKFSKQELSKPDFLNYTEDKLKLWKWSWNWKWSQSKNAWIISDMEAHCPKCDTPMIDMSNSYHISFDCPRCEFHASENHCDQKHKIERIILDNLNRRERT